MKICLVTPEYPGKTRFCGGIGTHYKHLSHKLAAQGHQVTVVVTDTTRKGTYQEGDLTFHELEAIFPRRFKWTQLNKFLPCDEVIRCLKTARLLTRLAKAGDIEVIETSSYLFSCLFYLYQPKHVPVLTRVSTLMIEAFGFEGEKLSLRKKISSWMERRCIEKSDFIVTHTQAHRAEIERCLKLSMQDSFLVPHGIELPENPVSAVSAGEKTAVKVFFIGRLEHRKGIDLLLEAIPAVCAAVENVEFIIAGPDREDYYRRSFESGADPAVLKRVHFAGRISDEEREHHYQTCDIFVAPSRYESFGLVYVEAMGYGKPVIGNAVGGVPEVVADGVTGILTDSTSEGLAAAMIDLCCDSQRRQRMGDEARRHTVARFSAGVMADNSISVYQQMLQEGKRSPAESRI